MWWLAMLARRECSRRGEADVVFVVVNCNLLYHSHATNTYQRR
jgi:hypothetical protein